MGVIGFPSGIIIVPDWKTVGSASVEEGRVLEVTHEGSGFRKRMAAMRRRACGGGGHLSLGLASAC